MHTVRQRRQYYIGACLRLIGRIEGYTGHMFHVYDVELWDKYIAAEHAEGDKELKLVHALLCKLHDKVM